jgi:hypothetical protein
MGVTVNIFNANTLSINVNVNNSAHTFQVPAANPLTWMPGVPAKNPLFTPGPPIAGYIGIGTNAVVLTPEGATSPFVAHITLSEVVNWSAIQIYVFFKSYTTCSWMVLNAGEEISQAFTYSDGLLKAR